MLKVPWQENATWRSNLLIHDQIYMFGQITIMISEECAGIAPKITISLAIHGIDRTCSVR